MMPGLHVPVQAAGISKQASSYPANRCSKVACKLLQAVLNPRPKQTVRQENVMKTKVWTRPEVKEVHLGCEINSYAPAEI